jgi:hypothetical protein
LPIRDHNNPENRAKWAISPFASTKLQKILKIFAKRFGG